MDNKEWTKAFLGASPAGILSAALYLLFSSGRRLLFILIIVIAIGVYFLLPRDPYGGDSTSVFMFGVFNGANFGVVNTR